MRRSAKHIICLLVVGIQSAWAETQETPVLIPAHEAILKELQNEPGAIRTFKLNDQKQIISIHVCRNLSSEDVAAIKRIETLEELHVGGVLPGYFCCGSPPAEVIKAEKQRLKNFKQAVPLLAELKTVKRMHLGDVPTESELQTVLGWNQLDLLSGPFLPKQCQELAKLPNLRSLFISRSQVALQPISGKFLQRLTNLQNLNLPKNFGDDVFEFIADSPNLKSLKGKGLSGEKLFDFYTTRAGLPPFKALREAGYHVRKRQSERINEIVFRGTHEFSTHFSPKVLDRLRHLEEMRFEYIEGHEAEILQAIREKPLTRLNIIGCDVSQECIQEICNLKTLEELTIDLRSKPMDIAIGDLPNLKTLALGGDLENGSSVASVHRMPELREFRTFRIRIEPSFIEQVAQLPNLTKASFFKESLSLETAASVAKLHNLTDLAFWDCDLDDEKLDLFYGLPNLRSVEFRDTEVSPDARIRFQREHLGLPTAAILKQAGLRIKRNPQGDVHEIYSARRCAAKP